MYTQFRRRLPFPHLHFISAAGTSCCGPSFDELLVPAAAGSHLLKPSCLPPLTEACRCPTQGHEGEEALNEPTHPPAPAPSANWPVGFVYASLMLPKDTRPGSSWPTLAAADINLHVSLLLKADIVMWPWLPAPEVMWPWLPAPVVMWPWLPAPVVMWPWLPAPAVMWP